MVGGEALNGDENLRTTPLTLLVNSASMPDGTKHGFSFSFTSSSSFGF